MLPKDLPECLCGKGTWTPGNSTFQPGLNQQDFDCSYCPRPALFLRHTGGNILLMPTTARLRFEGDTFRWINDVLLPTWRDCEARLKQAREPVEQRWRNYACDEIGVPRDTKNEDIPESKRSQWSYFWQALHQYHLYTTPDGFEKPLIPPQLPTGLTAYLELSKQAGSVRWEKVNREESLSQPVPPDPIRVRHDFFFNEVFATVRKNLGHNFVTEEVPNEYCDAKNEPWFRFTIGDNTIVVGPRKRVTTIKVTSPKGLGTAEIRNAAKSIDTTYCSNAEWKSGAPVATTLEVHAWNQDQLTQFLTILGKESLTAVSH